MRWTTQECKETWSWLQIYWPWAAWAKERKCQTSENGFRRKSKSEMAAKQFPQERTKVELLEGVHTGGIIPQVIASTQKGKFFSWFNFTDLDGEFQNSNSMLYIYRKKKDSKFWNDTSVTFCANSLVPSTRSKTAVIDIHAGYQKRRADLHKALGELCI